MRCIPDAIACPVLDFLPRMRAVLTISFSHILGLANTQGKAILPRLAALLDVAAVTDVVCFQALVSVCCVVMRESFTVVVVADRREVA